MTMKQTKIISIGFMLLFAASVATCVALGARSMADRQSTITPEPTTPDTLVAEEESDTDTTFAYAQRLAMAFAQVESGMRDKAVNGNCVGLLQISPVLVKECNRLLGEEIFTLADREDPYASIAMFVVIMDHKNPSYDLRKACRLWNPTAGNWYYERVKKALKNVE